MTFLRIQVFHPGCKGVAILGAVAHFSNFSIGEEFTPHHSLPCLDHSPGPKGWQFQSQSPLKFDSTASNFVRLLTLERLRPYKPPPLLPFAR